MILMMALGAVLSACNQRPPVEVAQSTVEEQLYWSRSLQNQRIAIEGFISFDNGPDGRAIAAGPELRSSPNGSGDRLIRFDAKFGSGPNQIGAPGMTTQEMFKDAPKGVPEVVTFDPRTLTYQDAQGAPHPIGERVRLVGQLRYAVSIENDPRSPTGQRYLPFLTHVVFEPAN
jgi:hypothetical protein